MKLIDMLNKDGKVYSVKKLDEQMEIGDITFDVGKVYNFGDGFKSVNEEDIRPKNEEKEYPKPIKKIFNKFGIPPKAHSPILTMLAYIEKNPDALKTILKSAGMTENKKGEN